MVKIQKQCGIIVAYGTRLDIGNWSGDCCLDGGESVEDARQTKQANLF